MTKNNHILAYAVVFSMLLMIFIFPAGSQEDMEIVDDSAFKQRTRPPVVFFHDAHNEKANIDECNVCHHLYEDGIRLDGNDSIEMECSECHCDESQDCVADLIRAFHLRCSGCHLKQKAGPVICGECHRKQ